jgi:molecular chaperone HtpG
LDQHYSQVQELAVSAEKQTHGFQAEVSRLLHLMIHSLYSNREIFLRELISNASDACDKLRFQALNNPALLEQGGEPQITLRVDKDAGTLTIADNGIGMSEDEVVDNLGTIARSGTEKFLANLSGDQKKDAQLIGQFGVGFYSAFIVAETVTVETRKAGEAVNNGVRWESDGKGEFTVETVSRDEQGTAVILHLRDDAKDFLDGFKIRQVIGQYSDHVAFPIVLERPQEGDEDTKAETLNSATALWQRPRSEVTDEEYQSFYKHISHDFQDALTWSHNKVEGKLEYTSLLYVPAQAPFDLYQREANRGLKLYVQRVFIMDDAEQFLPQYLRFIKGVIDAPDLPLNVSRELLQDYGPVQKIRSALTKRVLQMLKKLSNDDKQYTKFWAQFGSVIKEGVAEDRDNQQSIAALLRFATSKTPDSVSTSLDQYLESKPADQDCIYYLLADTPSAARQSPHLEVFRKKDIEVLLLSDPVDEWMVGYLESYKEVKLVNAARGELDLGDESEQANNDDPLIQRLAASLTEQVEAVRATTRLVDSPACLVLAEDQLGPQMRRMLEAAGQPVPENKPVLEVNLDHTLLQALTRVEEGDKFNDFAALLLDQAMLAEGQLPKDPAATARRMQALFAQAV